MTTTAEKPKHFKYGGSRLELLKACPGSIKAQEPYADQPAGAAAERGTRIHAHFEQAIKEDLSALTCGGGDEGKEINIGTLAARTVIELAREHGYSREELSVEVQLASTIHVEAGGTPDVSAAGAARDLVCFDLKTGTKYVSAEENLQLLFYALCAYDALPELTKMLLGGAVHLYIIQPEANPPHEVHVRKWSIQLDRLLASRQELTDIIMKAEANPDQRTPGEHCADKWCSARRECPAHQDWLNSLTHGALFKALEVEQSADANWRSKKVAALVGAGQTLADQLSALSALKDFIKRVEEDAKNALMTDINSVPGYGLSDSFGNRTWSDEKALDKLAKDLGIKTDAYKPRQVLSPAKFEDILREKLSCTKSEATARIADLTERPNTGVKVVKLSAADINLAALI